LIELADTQACYIHGGWSVRTSFSSAIVEGSGEERLGKKKFKKRGKKGRLAGCPGFSWDRVNFPPSSCCVLDLV